MELDNKTDGTPIKHTAVIKNLREELDTLRELNKHRERAKELRKQGLRPLRKIGDIKEKNTGSKEREITNRPLKYNKKDERDIDFTTWTTSGDEVEIALLAKIQNHRDISDNDNDNNVAEASVALRQQLAKMKLNGDLMPLQSDDQNNDDQNNNDNWTSVPVMTAARSMQVLTSRSETTLSRASMICYYRILREIYGAGTPDWTVGAARAGIEGKTSAFVTAECIRAIFTFRDSIKRTVIFFRETKKLLERYESLLLMTKDLKGERRKNHPLRLWADKTMDAMWLDWFLSTNQRKGQIVLFYNSNTNKSKQKTYDISKNDDDKVKIDSISEENDSNQLFQFNTTKENDVVKVTVKDVGEFFNTFLDLTKKSIDEAITHVKVAKKEIVAYRKEERKNFSKPDDNYEAKREAKRKFNRTMSSHTFALDKIEGSIRQLQNTKNIINSTSETGGEKLARLKNILGDLARESEKSVAGLNRVIAPTRQYIKTVIRRELSNPDDLFDAGELVFAAGTFGAMTNWQQDLLLNRACDKLVKALPESGRFLTKRPLHTTIGGYRMLPIGCEMTRCFAFLLTNMNYEFDSQLVGRMINIFEEALIPLLNDSYEKNTFIAWNFDSSPKPDKPSVWVSSVAVLALDQMVKMLDMRINRAVIRHFESIAPEKPHTDLPINDLIFADYGFDNYFYAKHKDDYPNARQISIQLELMRAQVMRASLPEFYPEDIEGIYSLILYGPPGTGKTTLAEVLAVNSEQYVVKLSPSDLNVEGEALIEGRARDVFEALTMLTQTVIIFDEFEPMVQSRQIDETAEEINETEEDRINRGFNKLAKELREIQIGRAHV